MFFYPIVLGRRLWNQSLCSNLHIPRFISEWVVRSRNTGRYTHGTPRCRGTSINGFQKTVSLKCSNYESYCVSNVSIFHNFFSRGFPSFFAITIHHRLSKFTVSSPQTLTYCRSWGGPALGPPIGRKSGFVRLFLARLRLGRQAETRETWETSDIWCDQDSLQFGCIWCIWWFVYRLFDCLVYCRRENGFEIDTLGHVGKVRC